jgi:hypothetical protein
MDDNTRAVALTEAQWTTLCTYILATTSARASELEAWEKLAAETNEDGTPKFPNAAANALYCRKLEEDLTAIRAQIERV